MGRVLVTGAAGHVGGDVVRELAARGHAVVATDLERALTPEVRARFQKVAVVQPADLTDPDAVLRLLQVAAPSAIVHLAASIPPGCYRNHALAHRINVDATANLLRAGEGMSSPPRFVLASSSAVYGSRNPYRNGDITASTPVNPRELYGQHKMEAEDLVRSSSLTWVILRLGGVMTPSQHGFKDLPLLRLESALPSDGRIHTVTVSDVARAFASAVTTDDVLEEFLIAGDDSHRLHQGDVTPAVLGAMGIENVRLPRRKGNPQSDTGWFLTDWMDTARSQEVLKFQTQTWEDYLADVTTASGRLVNVFRPLAPIVRAAIGVYGQATRIDQPANPWHTIETLWGPVR